ncbi:hypothetical protein B0H14DRAFT_2622690 [Mycena olivaceomarginata]|nr:hypothetical protein B0H14DRAFT_2622690 [Mycena olivaceomarginata]
MIVGFVPTRGGSIILAMLVPWAFVFLANTVYADFHFLSCFSSGPSANPSSPSLAIAVPTSDLVSCSGILGERMLVVQNLTQPIGQASVFSMDNFCEARRIDIRLASSDLLDIFNSGGDGTVVEAWRMQSEWTEEFQLQFGEPVANLYRQKGYNLSPLKLVLFFRNMEGSTTTQALNPTTVSASVSVSLTNVPNTSVPDIQSSPSSVGSTSAKSLQKTVIIVGTVLGALSLCLAMATALLIWSRRRRAQNIRGPDDPPIEPFTETAPVFQTMQWFPLATETSHSSALSPKTPGPISAAPYSPTAREELREAVREAVREAIPPQNARGASWDATHTDVLPPSYYRGETAR